MFTQLKAWYFKLLLWDTALVRSPLGEDFSVSELDRCLPHSDQFIVTDL